MGQLLSRESLLKTGYFHVARVQHMLDRFRKQRTYRRREMRFEMCLVGVIATQLWHHLFLGGGLCDLPRWTPPA